MIRNTFPTLEEPLAYPSNCTYESTTSMPRAADVASSGACVSSMTAVVRAPSREIGLEEKTFWRTLSIAGSESMIRRGRPIAFEGDVEELGFLGAATASTVPWPSLWTQPTVNAVATRGVVDVRHAYTEIFQVPQVIETAELPRWRPFIAEPYRDRASE